MEDDGPARELIIRLRPDVQQAVAARDAAIASSIASHPTPVKRPVGRPKVLASLGVQAPPGERHVGHSCNSGGVGGSVRCACICTSQQKQQQQQQQQKQQQLKKQAVWVRMHLQGRRGRGRGRGRGLETLEISETTTEEDEGEEEGGRQCKSNSSG